MQKSQLSNLRQSSLSQSSLNQSSHNQRENPKIKKNRLAKINFKMIKKRMLIRLLKLNKRRIRTKSRIKVRTKIQSLKNQHQGHSMTNHKMIQQRPKNPSKWMQNLPSKKRHPKRKSPQPLRPPPSRAMRI
jgi:hypothetical protein